MPVMEDLIFCVIPVGNSERQRGFRRNLNPAKTWFWDVPASLCCPLCSPLKKSKSSPSCLGFPHAEGKHFHSFMCSAIIGCFPRFLSLNTPVSELRQQFALWKYLKTRKRHVHVSNINLWVVPLELLKEVSKLFSWNHWLPKENLTLSLF